MAKNNARESKLVGVGMGVVQKWQGLWIAW
jgi:hypothetical protein